jgi:hypothetical protein
MVKLHNDFSSTRSTTITVKPRSRGNTVKERRRGLKGWLKAEQQEEVTNKFVANVPMLLLEVSLSLLSGAVSGMDVQCKLSLQLKISLRNFTLSITGIGTPFSFNSKQKVHCRLKCLHAIIVFENQKPFSSAHV